MLSAVFGFINWHSRTGTACRFKENFQIKWISKKAFLYRKPPRHSIDETCFILSEQDSLVISF